MVKETVLERDGEVIEKLPAWIMRIKLKDVGTEIRCKLSGKMKQRHISVIPWDWVKIEVNQYDMTQGRIVYRYNNYDSSKQAITESDVEDLIEW
jgi:translation initiation factor IF-1